MQRVRKIVSRITNLKIESGITYVSIGNFSGTVLGAVLWLILGTLLSKEDYGLLNYDIAIATIASNLSIFGLNITVTTFLAKKDEKILPESNLVVFLASLCAAIFAVLITNNLLMALLILGFAFFEMSTSELLGRKKYREYMVVSAGQKALLVVAALTLQTAFGINGILLGYVIASFAFSFRYVFSVRKIAFSFASVKSKWKFAFNNFVASMAMIITFSYDKLLIGPVFGFDVLGVYQFGLQFLMFLSVVPGILFSYLLPEIAGNKSRSNTAIVGILFSILIAIAFIFLTPRIIETYFASFRESIQLAQIMVLGVIPLAVSSIINSRLLGREKSGEVLKSSAIYLLSQTTLILVLGHYYGAMGLSIATVLSLSVQASYLFLANFSKEK